MLMLRSCRFTVAMRPLTASPSYVIAMLADPATVVMPLETLCDVLALVQRFSSNDLKKVSGSDMQVADIRKKEDDGEGPERSYTICGPPSAVGVRNGPIA
ncbi:hypothetical protein HPP92_018519 [Vanilla planifolia]|uniref:Uncharacterized protein n=1 Tax=Vanilla planifolia TaxID=51239 RepID=A0A835Q764_VANPL|nr:hypothetical protein HPP92_018519 [Vanilla planifolia]